MLGISRGSFYYQQRPTSDADLKLMRRIDELHMELPFAVSRKPVARPRAYRQEIAGSRHQAAIA